MGGLLGGGVKGYVAPFKITCIGGFQNSDETLRLAVL